MTASDLLVLSHLRWAFVFQRPQHLMTRFARQRRVFFVEEPVFDDGPVRWDVQQVEPQLWVARPHVPHGMSGRELERCQREMLDELVRREKIARPALWFYTPMALTFAGHIEASVVVYDCMDELSAFLGAPVRLRELEAELLRRADLVFTGGQSIYEAKRERHPAVYAFPSSVDAAHFASVKEGLLEATEQTALPHPRIGFFGVVDERLDLELLATMAELKPTWSFVIVGPVVKIDSASLPRRSNLYWFGGKKYYELPSYLVGWDVAMMPFAINEATRFISPTKTLEYLAAGKVVISTPIRDVVRPYGEAGVAEIADTPEAFVAAIERLLAESPSARAARVARGDALVACTSWDRTQREMSDLIERAEKNNHQSPHAKESQPCTIT